MTASFTERRGSQLRLRIRLTPNARTDSLGGLHLDAEGRSWLKASVRAVPEKGRANAALVDMLARRTGLARSRFQLETGATARTKTLTVAECGPAEERLLAGLAEA